MMTFPTEWNNKIHVPNHQPDKYATIYGGGSTKPQVSILKWSNDLDDLGVPPFQETSHIVYNI